MNFMNEISNCVLWEEPVAREEARPKRLGLSLDVRVANDVTIVLCRGRIVYRDEAATLSDRVSRLMPHFSKLVLDLSAVEMVDSAGLGEFVVLHRRATANRCSIKLAAPRSHVHRVFELTKLSSVFEVHSTLEHAIGSFEEQVA
jgi:anti-sigma B factor antagonist